MELTRASTHEDHELLAPGAKDCGGSKLPHFSPRSLTGAKLLCIFFPD